MKPETQTGAGQRADDRNQQRRAAERFENEGGSMQAGGAPQAAEAGARVISDVGLHERPVVAADGQAIGSVDAVFIDPATWAVRSLRVKISRKWSSELGSRRGFLRPRTLDIPVALVQSVGDSAVVLTAATAGLHQVLSGDRQGVTH